MLSAAAMGQDDLAAQAQAYAVDAAAGTAVAIANAAAAAATEADLAAAVPAGSDAAAMPAAAAAAAAAPQSGPQPAQEPGVAAGPKEDLKKRASAYVQQQLALMGQPAARHNTNGSSSSTTHQPGNTMSSYTAWDSGLTGLTGPGSLANNGSSSQACMMAPNTSLGWSGASGSYSSYGYSSHQLGGLGGSILGYKKAAGSGRGRGRRPKPRDSSDDPYDETYVPAGVSREEEIARCSNYSYAVAAGSPMVASNVSAAAGAAMGPNCSGSQATFIPTSSIAAYPGVAVVDAAAAAAMPCLPETASQSAAAAAAVAGGQYGSSSAAAAGATAGAAAYGHTSYHAVTGGMNGVEQGYSSSTSAAAAAVPAAGNACIIRRSTGPDGKLLGLEDAAVVDFASFRQSGLDFKVSLSSLDDVLTGEAAPGAPGDWNELASVAGLFRGTSLDGSRFSLTGSADGFGSSGRRSSRGGTLTSTQQRLSQQQLVHLHHHYQQRQPDHMLMPPPKFHHHQQQQHQQAAASSVTAVAAAHGSSSCTSSQHISGSSNPQAAAAAAGGAGPGSQAGRNVGSSGLIQTGRCESPFKAAAIQQAPFSPVLCIAANGAAAAAAADRPGLAPSSQPTVCSAADATLLGKQNSNAARAEQQQLQQPSPQQQQQQRFPATFQSVLQAILPGSNNRCANSPAVPAAEHDPPAAQAAAAAAAVTVESEIQPEACQREDGTAAAATTQAAAAAVSGSQMLSTQCPSTDAAGQQQQQRRTSSLLNPVGNLFVRPSDDGCLLLEDALGAPGGLGGFDLHTAADDSAQTRAERRSLRMLLGVLASTDPLAWEPAATTATAAAVVAGGAAAAAGDELCCLKPGDSSGSGQRRGSSSRLSHSSLLSGGCGLVSGGRTSSRGVTGWYGLAAGGVLDREVGLLGGSSNCAGSNALKRQRISGGMFGVGGDSFQAAKRSRVSLTLTSPVGGASRGHRVSQFMDTIAVGRPSAGGADMDDCLSFWQV